MTSARRRPPARPPVQMADGALRVANAIRAQERLLGAGKPHEAAGIEDVHQARVAARRLRSMLKTFRPLLEPRRARLYRVDLRSYARALAGVREADVRRQLLVAVADRDGSIPPADRERLDALLEDACIGARGALHRHRGEPGWAALRGALERDAGAEALFVEPGATLARVLGLVAQAWRRPLRLLESRPRTAEELHELRLALKHCRYALEPVADVAPKAAARLLRRLRDAQDCIGEHRDALLAEHWVRSKERQLGRDLATRLGGQLMARERLLRRRAARRSGKVPEAWAEWQAATRRLRKESTPDRA